jgi:hypothetical protein
MEGIKAVAEQATPALAACFKNRRLEEENRFMDSLCMGSLWMMGLLI